VKKSAAHISKPLYNDRKHRPFGYWPAFLIFSFIIHYAGYGLFSDAMKEFLESIPGRKAVIEKIIQVQLVAAGAKDDVAKAAADTVVKQTVDKLTPDIKKIIEEPIKGPTDKPAPPPRKIPLPKPKPDVIPVSRIDEPVKDIIIPKPALEKQETVKKPATVRTEPPLKPHVRKPAVEAVPHKKPAPNIDDIKVVDAKGNPIEHKAKIVEPINMERDSASGPPIEDGVVVIKGGKTEIVKPKGSEPVKLASSRIHKDVETSTEPAPAITSQNDAFEVYEPPAPPVKPAFNSFTAVRADADLKDILPDRLHGHTVPGERKQAQPYTADRETGPIIPSTLATASVVPADEYTVSRLPRNVYTLSGNTDPETGIAPAPLVSASLRRHNEMPELKGRIPISIALAKPRPLTAHSIAGAEDGNDDKSAFVLVLEVPGVPSPPPVLTIDTPTEDTTDKSIVTVAGTVKGEGVSSVVLSLLDAKQELLIEEGRFTAEVALNEGRNVIVGTAINSTGQVARVRKVIYYEPSPKGPYLVIARPTDRGVVDTRLTGQAEVLGYVEGELNGDVSLHLNSKTYNVTVTDGEFRASLPIGLESNVLYAEATDVNGDTGISNRVEFRALNVFPKDIIVLVQYGGNTHEVSLKHSWQPHPRNKGKRGNTQRPRFARESVYNGTVVEVERAVPGIYTVGLQYDLPATGSSGDKVPDTATFTVILDGKDPEKRIEKVIGPINITGPGYLPAVRLLMPERVFWEDNDWFTGIIESATETMKFRQPEGVIWKEAK